ncbi:MAG: DUF72 domain-containing protein [Actinomycetota bacterium]
MGEIRVGSSSWTDPTLLDSGWYPPGAKTAESRLRYYASRFSLVEVDSTYYALPSERNAALWVERTPASFTFDVKAYGPFTQHPVDAKSLPPELRHAFRSKRVKHDRIPASIMDMLFTRFVDALMPLHSAGKLGFILFQFPPWFLPDPDSRAWVERCQERMADYKIAIEFRNRSWFDDSGVTQGWLRERGLPMVIVDAPQGFDNSVPPVLEVTDPELVVFRFHGRNATTWDARGQTAAERFNYLYSEEELAGWVDPIRTLAEQARHTHVLFNNCYADKGVRNAARLAELVGAVQPDRTGSPPDQPSLLD